MLHDEAAIVTGASKGIGRALAVGLAAEGASVAINYNADAPGAEETRRFIETSGGRAIAIRADLGQRGEAGHLVAQVADAFGRLDILVNNAGIKPMKSAEEITDEIFDDVMNINLRAPFFASVAGAQLMRETGGGSIINISSCAASLMVEAHSVYTMSKGGLEALTKQLAFEFAPHVRVNAIAPGATDVESSREFDAELSEHWGEVTPLGRIAVPGDYVGPAIFLASDASQFLTGEILHVDGGWTIQGRAPGSPAQVMSAQHGPGAPHGH